MVILRLIIIHCCYINDVTDAAEIFEPSVIGTEYIKEEGNNITYRCVGVGYPPPLVQWRKLNASLSDRVSNTNMLMLTNEGNVTNVTVDLIFTGAYREDTGIYECSVSNLLNTATRNISLTVQCMHQSRDQPIMLIFYLLCYAAVHKILTYYAQYYAYFISLC